VILDSHAARQPGDFIDKINKKKRGDQSSTTLGAAAGGERRRNKKKSFSFDYSTSFENKKKKFLFGGFSFVREEIHCRKTVGKSEALKMNIFGDVICATARNSMKKIYMYHRENVTITYENISKTSHARNHPLFSYAYIYSAKWSSDSNIPPSHVCSYPQHTVTSRAKWNATDYAYQ
jgi:hypothetical protein